MSPRCLGGRRGGWTVRFDTSRVGASEGMVNPGSTDKPLSAETVR